MKSFIFCGEVPSKKNSYTRGRGGRVYKAQRVVDYEEQVADELLEQKVKEIKGPMAVSIEIGHKKRKDLDNVVTTLLDAMQYGGLYEDDNEIIAIQAKKRLCKKEEAPFAHVTIGLALDTQKSD